VFIFIIFLITAENYFFFCLLTAFGLLGNLCPVCGSVVETAVSFLFVYKSSSCLSPNHFPLVPGGVLSWKQG
jgi:hypothetical protein